MGNLNAGYLNQRIALISDGPAISDGQGGYLDTAADTEQLLYARVLVKTTTETLESGQVVNGQKIEVTIRHRPNVHAGQRLRWKAQTLSITGITPDEFNESLLLTCVDGGQ